MSDIHVGMSGMSEMSEMKRGSVGNVGIAKCECRDRVGSRACWTYVPILEDKCRRRTGSRFETISETGTNEDSETLLWYLISCYLLGLMSSANHMLFKSCKS